LLPREKKTPMLNLLRRGWLVLTQRTWYNNGMETRALVASPTALIVAPVPLTLNLLHVPLHLTMTKKVKNAKKEVTTMSEVSRRPPQLFCCLMTKGEKYQL
jgi:hypothetical protein